MRKLIVFLLLAILPFLLITCEQKEKTQLVDPVEGQVKVLYQCSMHPNEISEKPGDCYSMPGMKLIPVKMVYKNGKWIPLQEKKKIEEKADTISKMVSREPTVHNMQMPPGLTTVQIDSRKQQLIGVRISTVKRAKPNFQIRTVGFVDYNERAIYAIDLKFGGWIEKLFVDYTGEKISKGEPLFEIYSPEVLRAQEEYLVAFSARDKQLKDSILKKFELWGISYLAQKIEKAKHTFSKFVVYSPYSGFVIEKYIIEGQYVKSGHDLYKIADLSKVWIYGDVFEFELPFIYPGHKVVVESSYLPGEKLQGKISYIYPEVNTKTRTIRVRVEVKNSGFLLKPGMYVNLKLNYNFKTDEVIVPEEAVLLSGDYSYVFISRGSGYFEPRLVELGPKVNHYYIVVKGLKGGEKVVSSANFLIDSESKLKAAISGMSTHQH